MLTDRDERALIAAAENRITDPLRAGAALAAVRRLLRRERESGTWHPTTARTSSTAPGPAPGPRQTAPLPR